ncbi:hypothetical protein BCR33DRAFT_853862 [Rhizoclosmatium globosum]|uniref:RGS domain-containing protein n=1 Tax=Rhizoclosmatium globosum TaxID=329046 RepID=A0A1Y2BVX3_9FUNG|nr:hypothetical protein BCR33DRAFT_853862 [Rhizoclosmatium globosum]|eukprot:ORY38911.1 hypothetical protein BCR33DRAFT_853862 [Rhizoclosmatium globosum]
MTAPGRKITLASVLRDEVGPPYSLDAFRNYLSTIEYASENLDFWETCLSYRRSYVPEPALPNVPPLPTLVHKEGLSASSTPTGSRSPNQRPTSAIIFSGKHGNSLSYSFKDLLNSVDSLKVEGATASTMGPKTDSSLFVQGSGNGGGNQPAPRITRVKSNDFGMSRSKSFSSKQLPATESFKLDQEAPTAPSAKPTMTTLLLAPSKLKEPSALSRSNTTSGSKSVMASLGSLANMTSSVWSLTGSTKSLTENRLETSDQKRQFLEHILSKFFTVGGDSELNVPNALYERLAMRVREYNEYQPDVLKPIMEEVYLTMKNSSYPNFVKYIEKRGLDVEIVANSPISAGSTTPLKLSHTKL